MATRRATIRARLRERFVLRDVGWDGYQSLLKMVDDRRSVSPMIEETSS